jgi:hypothetical protein
MRRRKTRALEPLSLSFLDAITCGFGAIILLLVISKIYEPQRIEEAVDDTEAHMVWLEQRLDDVRADTRRASEQLSTTEAELLRERERLQQLTRELARLESAQEDVLSESEITTRLEQRLRVARQELTEEMERLLAQLRRTPALDQQVGGIPIDSEYIVFVIDTSPSMTEFTWPRMIQIMEEILDTYPQVNGMQVMNDMGTYLFRRRAGEWMDDTPALRDQVIRRLHGWRPFSNSSPVEGIIEAIQTYATTHHGVSVYYLGDEMHGHDLDRAARAVQAANRGPDGRPMARIHSVGFPVIYDYTGAVQETGLRFASLMRIICEQNDGTFVALHSGREGGYPRRL